MEIVMHKKRQVNFELLRILCMYMIVIGHCLFHGRVTAKLGYGTVNYFLSYLIQSFSVVHVNCFVMIGGYFVIDRSFKSERAIKLWKQHFPAVSSFRTGRMGRWSKGNFADFLEDLLVCIRLYGDSASDAICWDDSNTDQQAAVSISIVVFSMAFEC